MTPVARKNVRSEGTITQILHNCVGGITDSKIEECKNGVHNFRENKVDLSSFSPILLTWKEV